MKTSKTILAVLGAACTILAVSCATPGKIDLIRSNSQTAALSLPDMSEATAVKLRQTRVEDLTVKDSDGRELHIMNAIRDSLTGEMVASEQLRPAVLVARFRNVAERLGVIDLDFMIVVSDSLQDPQWQLRFEPVMQVLDDTVRLEPVLITGEDFRRTQLRGYERYDRYLKSLARDSLFFVNHEQVQTFMEREAGLSREEVEEHYSRHGLKWLNARRVSRKNAVRKRCIRVPIEPEYARLDTVCRGSNPFVYVYSHRLQTRPGLRKVKVTVDGSIWRGDKLLSPLPPSEPVTFYVSSLSSMADSTAIPAADSAYARAIRLLRDRDYKRALAILTPYRDYNTAVAFLALDYNATAAEILESLQPSAGVDYLLALSYTRRGREQDAVEHLVKAVAAEPSYKYRGNLDPEIAAIIRKFALFED